MKRSPVLAYLLLGSNLGDRAALLAQARARLAATAGEIVAASAIYETAAWGREDQPAFLNQALAVRTALQPRSAAGRLPGRRAGRPAASGCERWGSRTLDVDILLFGDRIIDYARPDRAAPAPARAPLCPGAAGRNSRPAAAPAAGPDAWRRYWPAAPTRCPCGPGTANDAGRQRREPAQVAAQRGRPARRQLSSHSGQQHPPSPAWRPCRPRPPAPAAAPAQTARWRTARRRECRPQLWAKTVRAATSTTSTSAVLHSARRTASAAGTQRNWAAAAARLSARPAGAEPGIAQLALGPCPARPPAARKAAAAASAQPASGSSVRAAGRQGQQPAAQHKAIVGRRGSSWPQPRLGW